MQGDLLKHAQVGSSVPESFSSEFNVPDEARILLRSTNGSVRVVPSSSGRLEVEVRVAGHVSVAGTKRLTTSLKPSDPYMILDTEYEDTGIRASADYVLGLPPKEGVQLTAELLNGSLSAESLPCGLDVSLGNGDLTASGLTGELRARLVNGSVEVTGSPRVSFVRAGGRVDMEIGGIPSGGASVTSLSGEVRVRLAAGLKLQLAVRAGSGGVSVEDLSPKNVVTAGGSLRGDLNGGGPRLALTSVSSGVFLGLAGS